MRLLAIRYPHPNGRRDFARVELVDCDGAGETAVDASWKSRLGGFLRTVTPGVAWGDGVLQAKALDIKTVELQTLIAKTQAAEPCVIRQVGGDNGRSPSRLAMQINGENARYDGVESPDLDALARRVERYGKLITCRASAAELIVQWNPPNEDAVHTASFHDGAVDIPQP